MKQHQLRAFLALAEGGSLVKAANALNKTPAAISKAIRELEEDFEVQFFHRNATGMSLTEGGKILLPRAQAMLAERRRADEALRLLRGKTDAHLRVGLSPAVSVLLAPALVERFVARMPSVRLDLFEYQREHMTHRLDDGTLDIALFAMPSFLQRDVDKRATRLYATEFALAVKHDGAFARAASLADLRDARWILSDPSGAQQTYIEDAFRHARLDPPARTMVCSASGLGVSLALKLDAVALIARPIAQAHPQLAVLDCLAAPPRLDIYSLIRATTVASPVVESFLDIARELGGSSALDPSAY
ncbi:LysR family transcriptional regulator [Pararobbsia silviterrae]|uniref:LysR family transcriptional regulator n=1 Tax=Pararobbsia silviterrae TaxID=1792498 RepID=UPI001314FEDD|nr:LysR family transcriptional regulator [Pararobbsia silviterrae]